MVVIGCGNLERGDDGAGILVAQRLRALGLDVRVHTGESLGLIDLWADTDEWILVDAAVIGAAQAPFTFGMVDGHCLSTSRRIPPMGSVLQKSLSLPVPSTDFLLAFRVTRSRDTASI